MPDMIDLATVTILRSPDVRVWPATAAITQIDVRPDNLRVHFTKQDGPDRWPDQPFGNPADHGTIQYTLWLFLQLAGRWYGAGFHQMWFGRDGVGDSIADFTRNWYDPRGFWGPMTGHVVVVREPIGFMVTAGNARLGGNTSVQERSNIVTILAPAGDTGVFDFPADGPPPPPPPVVDDVAVLLTRALDVGAQLIHGADALMTAIDALNTKIDSLKQSGLRVHP